MIRLCSGDIFDANVDIRVNTVNCVGAMGAGVALAFKTRYPEMFRKYKKDCLDGRIRPGKIDVWKQLDGTWIINFPTKRHWREPSRYEDIEAGLADLRKYLLAQGHVSIAIPALGCGHGGLDWNKVEGMITKALGNLDAEIHLYEPSSSRAAGEQVKGGVDPHVVDQLKREGVSILKPGGTLYPERLRGMRATTLFVKGNPGVLALPLLAIFPSRTPDDKEVIAATMCVEAIARPGITIMLGYGPRIERDLIRLALNKGTSVAIRFEEGISNFRVRKDIEDIWVEDRIAVIAPEAVGGWNTHTGRKMTRLALDLAKVALVTDPNPMWMQSFADVTARTTQVYFIDYRTSNPVARHALMSVGAKPVRRDARLGSPSVDEIVTALGVSDSVPQTPLAVQALEQDEMTVKTASIEPQDKMNRYPKRLIEVDLPIKRISAHARREKSIRHGHISTLHIWWARRPLAACRAVICAALWPDPADPLCPKAFREAAQREMKTFAKMAATPGESAKDLAAICDADAWKRYSQLAKNDKPVTLEALRGLLLDFIADAAAWEASTNKVFLQTARNLTQAAHEALGGVPGTRPLVVDPFAGGGSIPLEALRVGGDAFASDLNPIPVLLNKVVLEYIPKYGQKLADEVCKWGQWVKNQAEKELAEFYPKDPDGATPIAYLWARTIKCEGPGCGVEVPLIGTLCLGRKGKKFAALRYKGDSHRKQVVLDVYDAVALDELQPPIVKRFTVACPVCGYTTPYESVRDQLRTQHGGTQQARMVAIISVTSSGERRYRVATDKDQEFLRRSAHALQTLTEEKNLGPDIVPQEPLPAAGTLGFRVRNYGMNTWGELHHGRQLLSLVTYSRLAHKAYTEICQENRDVGLAQAIVTCLSFAVSNMAQNLTSQSQWMFSFGIVRAGFFGNALPMRPDFAEVNPLAENFRGFDYFVHRVIDALSQESQLPNTTGTVSQGNATCVLLPDDAVSGVVTDPPYYDAIPYAALSDFFYVWLKRCLWDIHPTLFKLMVTPKAEECIVDLRQPQAGEERKDASFFERTMTLAMTEARRIVQPDGFAVVVFAHKATAGWEAMLASLINASWAITASWPIDTEDPQRMRAKDSAALASSVHIVCRPRENLDRSVRSNEVGDWRDVLAELPKRIHEWLPRLAEEGVVGADAIFACLGPALEVFSRYSRVEKASGEHVTLREYLEQVWTAVSKEALGMIFAGGDATGFEEDARLTAMWLWTLASPNGQDTANGDEEAAGDSEDGGTSAKLGGGYALEYDAARKIAQGLGAHLEKLTGMVEIKGDTARLLSVAERTKALFGKDQADAPGKGKRKKNDKQMKLGFEAELEAAEAASGGWGEKSVSKVGETVLDRLHQSMILFAAGRGEALRRFLVDEGIGRDQRFWRLAQALSALYPANTDEKRWVDGVLARKKGLGF